MSDKKRKRIGAKNSTTNSPRQAVEVKKPATPEFKIGPDTICVLTIHEQGAIKSYEHGTPDEFKGKKNKFIPTTRLTLYHDVVRRMTLNNACIKHLVSDEGKPFGFTGNWKAMGKRARLIANLETYAEGNKFEWELIG